MSRTCQLYRTWLWHPSHSYGCLALSPGKSGLSSASWSLSHALGVFVLTHYFSLLKSNVAHTSCSRLCHFHDSLSPIVPLRKRCPRQQPAWSALNAALFLTCFIEKRILYISCFLFPVPKSYDLITYVFVRVEKKNNQKGFTTLVLQLIKEWSSTIFLNFLPSVNLSPY